MGFLPVLSVVWEFVGLSFLVGSCLAAMKPNLPNKVFVNICYKELLGVFSCSCFPSNFVLWVTSLRLASEFKYFPTSYLSSSTATGICNFLYEKWIELFRVKGLKWSMWNVLLMLLRPGTSEKARVTFRFWALYSRTLKGSVHFAESLHSLNLAAAKILVASISSSPFAWYLACLLYLLAYLIWLCLTELRFSAAE